ncbi:hypothetical protein DL93DRAFT_2089735 [Clavulina sp. PMI_390]|nr:hypothetical protein DL93DRAFT_2089735 [Clavulina sp. PMI_390]
MAQVPLLPFPSAYRPTTIITNPPSEQNVIEAVGYHADIWARRYKSTEEVPTEIIVDASRYMQSMIYQKDFGQIPNHTLQQTLDDIKAKSDLIPQLVDAVNQLHDSVNQLQNNVDQLRTAISLTTQLACETHNNVSQVC